MAIITSRNPLSEDAKENMALEIVAADEPGQRLVFPLAKAKNIYSGTKKPFCDNTVRTGKYNAVTFVPIFLFNSFQKLVNAYFGVVAVMQCKFLPNLLRLARVPFVHLK